jgi:hypothetical protein
MVHQARSTAVLCRVLLDGTGAEMGQYACKGHGSQRDAIQHSADSPRRGVPPMRREVRCFTTIDRAAARIAAGSVGCRSFKLTLGMGGRDRAFKLSRCGQRDTETAPPYLPTLH